MQQQYHFIFKQIPKGVSVDFRYFEEQKWVMFFVFLVFFTTLNVLCGRLDFIGLEHSQLNVHSYCCASGHAVQCLAEFNTSGALQWLGTTGPTSLLEQTGLAQAVQLGRRLTSPKIINITLGGKT